jgi:hypothetical protein
MSAEDGGGAPTTSAGHDHGPAHAQDSRACPRCRALEARVAELEQQLAAIEGDPGARLPALPPAPLMFKALRLVAHGWGEGWSLRPSPVRRHWMDERRAAYYCLPMVAANQWGWQVLCPTDVRVTWDGTPEREGLLVDVDPQYAVAIKSQFGAGIVTFSPPWLFRTPPGWDLYAKGPSNRWKPNCVPLEGVIETWWLNYTSTLNWKLNAPGVVTFAKGESLAQLIPVPHTTFIGAEAIEAPIAREEPEAAEELLAWLAERRRLAETARVHQLYRKAEDVLGHLNRVPVPPFRRVGDWPDVERGS